MKDETWGAIGWWIGTTMKWVGLLAVALLVLFLLAVAIGMHGWPF